MTLKEFYLIEKQKPTPAQQLVSKIADATCREEATVRQWLSGVQLPNQKARERIAQIVGLPVDELFPTAIDDDETKEEE
ncbi:MAG: hypothetical protein HDT02_06680 [Bacteroidales bacterium]|nr:hypothetical protein [Bacteroidales bacterium]MBD5362147.1 hypothetical protein [Bacteroides sp.]